MPRRHRILFAALVLLSLSVAGCSDRPPLGQIQGTVTLDDKPLPNGTLTFEAPGLRPATARIENGKIVEATTFTAGDGVPVGSHKVAVSATEAAKSAVVTNPGDAKSPPPADYMSGKSLIPARYNDPATSKLTAEIKKGDNTLEFKLTSK